MQAACTEAGMFALRERRIHVTQEDFEMAVSKVTSASAFNTINVSLPMLSKCISAFQVMQRDAHKNMSLKKLFK